MKKVYLSLIAIFLLSAQLMAAEGDVVVIVNKGVPDVSISGAVLKLIYLGKKNTWSDGSAIVPVDLNSGKTQNAFLSAYIQKSTSQYSSFWKQAIFTGEGTPPRVFSSVSELVSYVANTPGAIGYVPAGTATGSVRKLRIE